MQLKKEELKKQGKGDAEVNEVTEESIISAFGITNNHMLKAARILEAGEIPKIWEILQPDYQIIMDLQTMGKVPIKTTKMFSFIQTGSTKGTTFKINASGLVFSSLFDTGAHISCIIYDTVATLGLLGQISDNNINVRTKTGQDMGVVGAVMVNFKIAPCSFAHKFIVCGG